MSNHWISPKYTQRTTGVVSPTSSRICSNSYEILLKSFIISISGRTSTLHLGHFLKYNFNNNYKNVKHVFIVQIFDLINWIRYFVGKAWVRAIPNGLELNVKKIPDEMPKIYFSDWAGYVTFFHWQDAPWRQTQRCLYWVSLHFILHFVPSRKSFVSQYQSWSSGNSEG